MSNVHLSIGTATNRINLIESSRIGLYEWEPSETPLSDTFSESTLGDGRVLSSYREENAIESFGIHLKGGDPNSLIGVSRDIRQMLINARNYWTTAWQGEPVYLKARGACETNFRYAIVYTGQLPSDVLPWGEAFARENVMQERTLVVERGPWADVPPGASTCIEIEAGQYTCYPNYLEFDGIDDEVNCHSDAQLDDIIGANQWMEVEAWIKPDSINALTSLIIGKWGVAVSGAGWLFRLDPTLGLGFNMDFGTTDAYAWSGTDEFSITNEWVHVYACIERSLGILPASHTPYLAINGTWVATYASLQQGAGAYASDASYDCMIGNMTLPAGDAPFDGKIGWVRARDTVTRTVGVDFTPDLRCEYPIQDANTVGLWIHEGDGVTTGNDGTGTTAGDITGAVWGCDCPRYYGIAEDDEDPVVPTYAPGTFVGTFYKPTGGAPVSQDITIGFKPQVVLIWGAPNTSGSTTVVADVLNTMGMGTIRSDNITIDQAGMGWAADHSLNPNPATRQYQSNAAIVCNVDHTGTMQAQARIVSFNDDGITLQWINNNASAWPYHIAAFRSNFITDSMIKLWNTQLGVGNQAITGVGFQPNHYIDMGGGCYTGIGMPSLRQTYYCGLGAYDGSNVFGSGWASVNGGGLGGLAAFVQDIVPMHYMPNSAAVPSIRARIDQVSLDVDGVTVNHVTNPGALSYYHHLLALKGSNFAVGTFTQTGAGAQAVASVGFQPDLVLLFFNGTVNGAAVGPPANPSFGACDENLNVAATTCFDDRVNPTDCARAWSNSHCIMDMTAVGALRGAASMTSLDALGFTLNWSTWTGGANHPGYYIAIKVQ